MNAETDPNPGCEGYVMVSMSPTPGRRARRVTMSWSPLDISEVAFGPSVQVVMSWSAGDWGRPTATRSRRNRPRHSR